MERNVSWVSSAAQHDLKLFTWSGSSNTLQIRDKLTYRGALTPSHKSCHPKQDKIAYNLPNVVKGTHDVELQNIPWSISVCRNMSKTLCGRGWRNSQILVTMQLCSFRQRDNLAEVISWKSTYGRFVGYQCNKCIKILSPSLDWSTSSKYILFFFSNKARSYLYFYTSKWVLTSSGLEAWYTLQESS